MHKCVCANTSAFSTAAHHNYIELRIDYLKCFSRHGGDLLQVSKLQTKIKNSFTEKFNTVIGTRVFDI